MDGCVVPRPTEIQQRDYQRRWVASRREAFFAEQACAECGSRDDLHLHHRDPEQKADHRIWSWAQERREAEISKCDVLCAPCHREHHALESRRHGIKRYEKGCRCDVCRTAKSESNARYLARRKEAA